MVTVMTLHILRLSSHWGICIRIHCWLSYTSLVCASFWLKGYSMVSSFTMSWWLSRYIRLSWFWALLSLSLLMLIMFYCFFTLLLFFTFYSVLLSDYHSSNVYLLNYLPLLYYFLLYCTRGYYKSQILLIEHMVT